ncbi:hypothetical protein Golax_024616 [Gossypium laxum]|uniref:Reverse transcriptase n=1 Tax=Gossypium laxum TaxID=34288 RepID=A0A7J8ZE98_9ROSI|nr:hypothetical protein [Gossypium laxum]
MKDCDRLLLEILTCVSRFQNEESVAEFRREEVVETIRAMAPLKASGKDGFPTLFYQKFWHVVGDEVEKFFLEVMNGQCDVEGINGMNIIFIPNIVSPKNMALGVLKSYKLVTNSLYPVREVEEELVAHLFYDCVFSKQVLGELVWLSRQLTCNTDVVGFINSYIMEIEQLSELSNSIHIPKQSILEPPKGDTIKLNFKAYFNHQLRTSYSGIIARNREGLVMALCTSPWENIPDPTMAEAQTCLKGDALIVIQKLKSIEEDRSKANATAHGLVLESRKYNCPMYWVEEVRREVEWLVDKDRRGVGGSDHS